MKKPILTSIGLATLAIALPSQSVIPPDQTSQGSQNNSSHQIQFIDLDGALKVAQSKDSYGCKMPDPTSTKSFEIRIKTLSATPNFLEMKLRPSSDAGSSC